MKSTTGTVGRGRALAVALVLATGLAGPAGANPILSDTFDDDSGDLVGEAADIGQTWALSSKAETGGRTLTTGTQYGQAGTVGAGDAEASTPKVWKGNMISLGQQLGSTPGVYTLSADLLKFHAGGGSNHEMSIILRSSTQGGGRETLIRYVNDRLQTGGNWFAGADLGVSFGTPGSIHVDLTLDLVPGGGTNSATLEWYEIGNPTANGSAPLGTVDGELLYDEVHLLTYTQSGRTLGFDNVSVTLIPEPGALALLAVGAFTLGLIKRRESI